MSNVLIGIIGVILFIGLALAGAVFFGPRFQETNEMGKASKLVQSVKQVADAAILYEQKNGQKIPLGQINSLVDRGYIKTIPTIPGANITVINESGCSGCSTGESSAIAYYLGTSDEARRTCEAVAKRVGQTGDLIVSMRRQNQSVSTGCMRHGDYATAMHHYVFTFI